jgi:hypothetical protein
MIVILTAIICIGAMCIRPARAPLPTPGVTGNGRVGGAGEGGGAEGPRRDDAGRGDALPAEVLRRGRRLSPV